LQCSAGIVGTAAKGKFDKFSFTMRWYCKKAVLLTRASAEKFPGGQRKKQDRKITPLSLPLLYQYHV